MALQLRRGTDAERTAGGGVVFAEGELVYITDTEEVYVGDGVTPGGIRITGSVEGSPAQLTQNLDINTFDIVGSGNITIDGTITASNISGGGGLIEGQEYAIDIMGDVKAADSSIIVDHTSGIVYADFVGDGSLITGVNLSQLSDTSVVGPQNGQVLTYQGGSWVNADASGGGLIEGLEYQIDIIGVVKAEDSTVLLDNVTSTLNMDTVNYRTGSLTQTDSGAVLSFTHSASSGTVANNADLGQINFGRTDTDGTATAGFILGANHGIFMAHNTTGASVESDYLTLKTTGLAVGSFDPTEKLDVRGNIKVSDAGIRFNNLNDYATNFPSPVPGDLTWDTVEGTLVFRSTSGWNKVVYTEVDTDLTIVPGPIIVGGGTTAEIGVYDDSVVSGFIAYNTDLDRVVVYQAGSFVPIPNAGAEVGHVLKWDGTQWSSAAETGSAPVGSNADFLDGFDSTYFLNYNNLNNTPNLATVATSGSFADILSKPTTIAGYGITDAVTDFADLGTTPTTIAGYGITDAFDGAYSSLTGTPTTLAGYGITDAVAASDLGTFTFTSSTLDTNDSSGITVTPPVIMESDLTVQNNLTVTNTVTADRFEATGTGPSEIEAATNLNLVAGNAVVITNSPLRMASFTTAERDALASADGDMIYNTTTNKFQGYANGAWVDLH